MPTKHVSTRYIRFATRERPTDRFLTAQIREAKEGGDERSQGDLYFVVEIHNPWFPNSQIGQTIINTVVREYRRADSTSTLTNFELALRKTNGVLAQITQTGETDWIGNLSSIIMLVAEGHVYLAQTGRAHGYLLREGKVSEITEGLEEEATQHPLTTYTNITSGTLETGDRVLLASSQIAETVSPADLKLLFGEPLLREAAREFVRFLQQHRARRVNGFVLEANPPSEIVSETIYTDETLNNFGETISRFFHRSVRPALNTSAAFVRTQTNTAHLWTRDWLIPRLVSWGQKTGQSIHQQSRQLATKTQPFLQQTRQRATEILPQSLIQLGTHQAKQATNPAPTDRHGIGDHTSELEETDLTGKTIYRVHHYQEPRAVRDASQQLTKKMTVLANRLINSLNQNSRKLKLSRLQLTLLGVAGLVILAILFSTLNRHTTQVAQTQATAATDALAQAQTAQKTAERAFILGQKETAKIAYTEAISLAQKANANADTQAAAAAVISASENVLNQLISATRLETPTPLVTFDKPISQLGTKGTKLLGTTDTHLVEMAIDNQLATTTTGPVTMPGEPAATNANTFVGDHWIVAGTNNAVYRYGLVTHSVDTLTAPNNQWKPMATLASFGNNLYALDTTTGQIWKYPLKGTAAAEPKPYLKSADSVGLEGAISLAIDGELYVLTATGTATKYSKGERVKDWKLSGVPTPWTTIDKASAIYTNATTNHIYLFENRSGDRPARFIQFDKAGKFVRQLLLPQDWLVQTTTFNPDTASGVVIVNNKAYPVAFPQN